MLTHILGDLRYAALRLAGSPGFMAAAVVTIALGVGINTGLFSVLNGVDASQASNNCGGAGGGGGAGYVLLFATEIMSSGISSPPLITNPF